MKQHLYKVILKELLILSVLLCGVVHLALTEELPEEETDIKDEQRDLTVTVPNSSEDISEKLLEEFNDDVIPTQADYLQEPKEDKGEEIVEESQNSQGNTNDYSLLESDYLSYYSKPSYYVDTPHESSFSKPFFPDNNDREMSILAEMAEEADITEGSEGTSDILQVLLCSILGRCDNGWNGNNIAVENGNWEISNIAPEIASNELKFKTKAMAEDSENETNMKESDNDKNRFDNKRSAEDESRHDHRVKRDLSWDTFSEADDDTLSYTEELQFLKDIISNDDTSNPPGNTLAEMLDTVEGVRQDRLSAGDILEEFEQDPQVGELPFANTNMDNLLRKRNSSPRDKMRHFVQSLPTLEGMRKRSDQFYSDQDLDEVRTNALPRDFVVAAENELAAEELENIETKAQVAAAMLDDAAMLIAMIENMAVDLVGNYLGLNEESDDDDTIDYPVEFEEFPQYLPPVPPVSVEKRIGRQRGEYSAVYDYPFAPEEPEQPYIEALESLPKSRYSGGSDGIRWSTFRRLFSRKPYRDNEQRIPPPLVGKHIGIFPDDDFTRLRYRRDQLHSPYLDNTDTDDPIVWELLAKESSRIFPIYEQVMERLSSGRTPYVDGYFTPDTNPDEDSLDKLWPVDNTLGRDIPLKDGLQQAFEAAAMMQDKMERENQLLEEKDNELGEADDAFVEHLLSNILRDKSRNAL